MTLLELAERCEKETGQSWSIDADIARTQGFWVPNVPTGGAGLNPSGAIPRYTKWVDHALTLVPDGCGIHTASEYGEQRAKNSHTFKLTGRMWARVYTPHHGSFETTAVTLSLALCAAALRARAAIAMEASGRDGATRLDAKHDSAVPERQSPGDRA